MSLRFLGPVFFLADHAGGLAVDSLSRSPSRAAAQSSRSARLFFLALPPDEGIGFWWSVGCGLVRASVVLAPLSFFCALLDMGGGS